MTSRNDILAGSILLLLNFAGGSGAAFAQQAPAPAQPPRPPPESSERPEYRTRALPTDTFKPSEQVSEDYAIPFPADI